MKNKDCTARDNMDNEIYYKFLRNKLQHQEYSASREKEYNSISSFLRNIIPYFTIIYALIIVLFLYLNKKNISSSFPNIFGNNSDKETIIKLSNQVNLMSTNFTELNNQIASISASASEKETLLKLSQLETKYNSLSETVLYDADKALTSRLLREKQNYLDNQIQDLKNDQLSLKNTFINLILAIIGTPLITIILPLIIGKFVGVNKNNKEDRPTKNKALKKTNK